MFFKNINFIATLKINKNLSQNVKSRIPIRVSKFLTLLCTPTGAFNVAKKPCFGHPFLRSGKNVDFYGKYQHYKMFIIQILGAPKSSTFKKSEMMKFIKTMIYSVNKKIELLTSCTFIMIILGLLTALTVEK